MTLWHLLTDCFPRESGATSTTGVSELGVLCLQGAQAVVYSDGGASANGGSNTDDSGSACAGATVRATGHCAALEVVPQQACSEDMRACRAAAGVSSNDPELWRTFAHEVRGDRLTAARRIATTLSTREPPQASRRPRPFQPWPHPWAGRV